MDIKYHYIRDQVQNNRIKLLYCSTDKMLADMFTKDLSRDKFEKLRSLAGVVPDGR